jgi:hypothetical protein
VPTTSSERAGQRCRDGIELRVGERLDRLDPAVDREHLRIHAQHRLDVPVLVGQLPREQKLQFVVRGGKQEGREQGSDVELGMEAVRGHPNEAGTSRLVQSREDVVGTLEASPDEDSF